MSLSRRRFLQSAIASAAWLHPGLRLFADDEAKPATPKSPFLEGNFAPVHAELAVESLEVTGAIPACLEGTFARNGPNPRFDPIGKYHWFDGDGMVHAVSFREGKASYRNRWVRTKGWKEEDAAGKALYGGIMDVPDMKRVAGGGNPYKNAANTALVHHHRKLLALWEGGEPYEVRVADLETVGPETFAGALRHPFTAHPKVDPATGEMLFFGYVPTQPRALFSTASREGELTRTVEVALDRPAMIHDFAITKHHAVFPVCPQTFEMRRFFAGKSPWHFEAERPTKWLLVPRAGDGKPIAFEAKTCFAFHLLNAYESGDEVVVIGCRYPRFPGSLSLGDPRDPAARDASVAYRWRLDVKTGAVAEGPIDDRETEFPRIHDAFTGRECRFGWLGIVSEGDLFSGLRKLDLATGKTVDHLYGPGRFGGEGVFVPRPGGKDEDDGWLLAFVFDPATGKSELTVLDAKDLASKPLARVHLPARVPYGFHGTFVPAAKT